MSDPGPSKAMASADNSVEPRSDGDNDSESDSSMSYETSTSTSTVMSPPTEPVSLPQAKPSQVTIA